MFPGTWRAERTPYLQLHSHPPTWTRRQGPTPKSKDSKWLDQARLWLRPLQAWLASTYRPGRDSLDSVVTLPVQVLESLMAEAAGGVRGNSLPQISALFVSGNGCVGAGVGRTPGGLQTLVSRLALTPYQHQIVEGGVTNMPNLPSSSAREVHESHD